MTRTEREEILRRYIDGELSLEEEHEFFIEVALDKELRHSLKAQREIDEAIKAHRGKPTPSEYASMQTGVAAVLTTTGAPQTTTPGTSSSPFFANWSGSTLIAGIAGSGLILLTVLVLLVNSPSNTSNASYPPNGTGEENAPRNSSIDQRTDPVLPEQTSSKEESVITEQSPNTFQRSEKKSLEQHVGTPSPTIEDESSDDLNTASPDKTVTHQDANSTPQIQSDGSTSLSSQQFEQEQNIDVKAKIQWKTDPEIEQPK